MLGFTYIGYIAISLGITIWVGHTLHKNGRVFLLENYADKPQLADAINHMLLVGFYLINIGFIAFSMKTNGTAPINWTEGLEFLSTKIGFMAIVLGTMHFGLMFALQQYSEMRREPKLARPQTRGKVAVQNM